MVLLPGVVTSSEVTAAPKPRVGGPPSSSLGGVSDLQLEQVWDSAGVPSCQVDPSLLILFMMSFVKGYLKFEDG